MLSVTLRQKNHAMIKAPKPKGNDLDELNDKTNCL